MDSSRLFRFLLEGGGVAAVKDMPFLAIDVLIRCSYDPREVVGQRERGGGV